MSYCAGIDVGGTTVKCGIFTDEGVLVDKWEIPTRKENGGVNILPDIAESILVKMKSNDIASEQMAGIGLGVPGPVEPDGHVPVCVNLGWQDIYPARILSGILNGVPCFVGNDANVAALGEAWQGAAKGCDDVVAITLGTGVGGGIITGGHILSGSHGLSGEIGHMHVRDEEKEYCNCGGQGCLEQVSSATGIVREARRNMAACQEPSAMRAFGDKISAKDVCDCAKANDPLADKTIHTCMRYLGLALSYMSYSADPQMIVIGGGVANAGDWLIEIIKQYYDQYTPLAGSSRRAMIIRAALGNNAGIYGAARMALNRSVTQ